MRTRNTVRATPVRTIVRLGALVRRTVDLVTFGTGVIAASALVAFILLFLFGIIARRAQLPIFFVDSVATYLFAITAALGLAYTLKRDRHASADLFLNAMSPQTRKRFEAFIAVVGSVSIMLLTWAFWLLARGSLIRGTTDNSYYRFPLFPVQLIILGGLVAFLLAMLLLAWDRIATLRAARDQEELSKLP